MENKMISNTSKVVKKYKAVLQFKNLTTWSLVIYISTTGFKNTIIDTRYKMLLVKFFLNIIVILSLFQ